MEVVGGKMCCWGWGGWGGDLKSQKERERDEEREGDGVERNVAGTELARLCGCVCGWAGGGGEVLL